MLKPHVSLKDGGVGKMLYCVLLSLPRANQLHVPVIYSLSALHTPVIKISFGCITCSGNLD